MHHPLPVGALRERVIRCSLLGCSCRSGKDHYGSDRTGCSVLPGVKASDFTERKAALGKLVAALKQIGFDYVFDTGFTADLTIMEEGSEFLQHFGEKDKHKVAAVHFMLPGLGSFREERIPGICRESFYCKISAADVRCHE